MFLTAVRFKSWNFKPSMPARLQASSQAQRKSLINSPPQLSTQGDRGHFASRSRFAATSRSRMSPLSIGAGRASGQFAAPHARDVVQIGVAATRKTTAGEGHCQSWTGSLAPEQVKQGDALQGRYPKQLEFSDGHPAQVLDDTDEGI
jgi:hypothetical protein